VTLNALLAAFDIMNENDIKWPIYGANLIIEIYKSNDLNKRNASNYSVNLYYCEQVNNSLNNLKFIMGLVDYIPRNLDERVSILMIVQG